MLLLQQSLALATPEWQQVDEKLHTSVTLASLVLTAGQRGLWFANTLVEQQLTARAQQPQPWGTVPSALDG